jgi:hypothetical protein
MKVTGHYETGSCRGASNVPHAVGILLSRAILERDRQFIGECNPRT